MSAIDPRLQEVVKSAHRFQNAVQKESLMESRIEPAFTAEQILELIRYEQKCWEEIGPGVPEERWELANRILKAIITPPIVFNPSLHGVNTDYIGKGGAGRGARVQQSIADLEAQMIPDGHVAVSRDDADYLIAMLQVQMFNRPYNSLSCQKMRGIVLTLSTTSPEDKP